MYYFHQRVVDWSSLLPAEQEYSNQATHVVSKEIIWSDSDILVEKVAVQNGAVLFLFMIAKPFVQVVMTLLTDKPITSLSSTKI